MSLHFFTSDLHGRLDRYNKLFQAIRNERPEVVLLGGDLLPFNNRLSIDKGRDGGSFMQNFLKPELIGLKHDLELAYPTIMIIPGNDDPKMHELELLDLQENGLVIYLHGKNLELNGYRYYGYAFTPPSPYQLKDWERYDVSRYVDPGCVSPEEGAYSVAVTEQDKKYATIQNDLVKLTEGEDLNMSIMLFHAPPHKTNLDRAGLDGKMIDHIPLDVHVGSIAVRRFIELRQPLLTLHGHIHESARLTGSWRDQLGETHCFTGAHDDKQLSLVRFTPNDLPKATRELI
ncbi:metallophosphoesterase [Calditrichota bacterium]